MINSLKIGDLTWRHLNNPTEEDFEFLKEQVRENQGGENFLGQGLHHLHREEPLGRVAALRGI